MNLKLFSEQTRELWTLSPGHEFFVGSNPSCGAVIGQSGEVSDYHLKFYFDANFSSWILENLSQNADSFVNNQPFTQVRLNQYARVVIANKYVFTATPESFFEVSSGSTMPPTQAEPSQPPVPSGQRAAHSIPTSPPTTGSGALRVYTWSQYVKEQVSQVESFRKFTVWYHLITGLRKTPWFRTDHSRDFDNFHLFDGFVIPNFQGSVDSVTQSIETHIGSLQTQNDTDCFVALLTDAHVANTAVNSWKPEFFPIKRKRQGTTGQPDYRRFCVTSYHLIRNYLLIEQYGSNLYVGWITRCEPRPTSLKMILWAIAAILVFIKALDSKNWALIIMPLIIWGEVFYLTPLLMEKFNILPKGANARLITVLMVIPSLLILSALSAAVSLNNYLN